MVAIGLVKVLTTKAAMEAALGAGAKFVGTYSYGLNNNDIKKIKKQAPDLILLTGGTDGVNKEVLIGNAMSLVKSHLNVPVVIAGNRMAAETAQSIGYAYYTTNHSSTVQDRSGVRLCQSVIC